MAEETHVLDQLPAYALGSLDAEEAGDVKAHLSACMICRAELESFQDVATHLSLVVSAEAPPSDLRDRLIQRVRSTHTETKAPTPTPVTARPWLERLLPIWGFASLCLIIALGAVNLLLWQRLDRLEFFTSSGGMRAVPLSPSDTAPRATGFVLISADGEDGALIVDGLPPLGEEQQYQLWLIRNGQRTSGAVFSTDEKSYGGTRIRVSDSLLLYSAADITIEPTGGSAEPTGTQVLGGPLFNP